MIDIERLRKDIVEYLEEESFMIPESIVLLSDAKYASDRKLLDIADELKFDLNDYED